MSFWRSFSVPCRFGGVSLCITYTRVAPRHLCAVALPVNKMSRPRLNVNGNVRSTLSSGHTIDRFLVRIDHDNTCDDDDNDRHVAGAHDVSMPIIALWLLYTATNHTDSD
jgi:hypothetical protein